MSPVDAEAVEDVGNTASAVVEGEHLRQGLTAAVARRVDVPTTAVGPIASLFEMDEAVAESIGWDGVGAPLASLFTELTSLF